MHERRRREAGVPRTSRLAVREGPPVRPLILVPTINYRHWNACYLQLLSVQRCQHPPQAERYCWGGGRPWL